MNQERQCRNFTRLSASAGVGLAMLALLVFLLPGMAKAQQSVSANILGTVTDQSGAVIPGAQITVKNLGTGITNSAKSDERGEYLVQYLQIGNYEVTIDAKGFKKHVAKDIALTAGDRARVDAKMALGSATETVTVSEVAAPALQTDTSAIGSEIPSTNIQDVPLNGRNLTDLVLMSAGVQNSQAGSALSNGCQNKYGNTALQGSPDDCRQSSAYVVNGQSETYQNNQLDGMDNNDRHIGAIEVKPSIDAIEEVKVQTGLYSAESGRTSGGLVQLVTKSGTNSFKGSAYEYLRNDLFDANTTWAATSYVLNGKTLPLHKPELRQNQFGVTYGGPVFKNRTFFFADYEGLRNITGQSNSNNQVPFPQLLTDIKANSVSAVDADLTAEGLEGTETLASQGVTSIDSVARTLMTLFPTNPTYCSTSACYYNMNPARKQNSDTGDLRIDQHFNDRNTMFGRFSYNKTETTNPGTYAPYSTTIQGASFAPGGLYSVQPELNISLDYTHIYKPNLILDLKAGYTYAKQSATPTDPLQAASVLGFDCGTGVTCPSNIAGSLLRSGMPEIDGLGSTGSGGGPPGSGGGWGLSDSSWFEIMRDHTHQYSGSLTWTKGTQNLKFGVSLIDRLMSGAEANRVFGTINFSADTQTASGPCNGPPGSCSTTLLSSTQEFLMGNATMKSRSFQAVDQHMRSYEPSAYVQDDWRVMPKLTLNLGLRYDLYTPYSEENGYLSNFNPYTAYTYNGINYTGILVSPDMLGAQHSDKYAGIKVDYHDIQPRVGFAYTLPQSTVLRGGFGMSYYPSTEGANANSANAPFTYGATCGSGSSGGPSSTTATPFGTAGSACTSYTAALDDGFPNPDTGATYMLNEATNPTWYASEGSITSTDPNLKTSYVYQYSLQAQKDWRSNIITVGYVGNITRHLASSVDDGAPADSTKYNPADNFDIPFYDLNNYTCVSGSGPGATTAACPNNSPSSSNLYQVSPASVNFFGGGATSKYNALQATFLRRSSTGLTTSINYTYSHSLGNQSQGGAQSGQDCTHYGCRVDDGKGTAAASLPQVGPQEYDYGNTSLDLRQRISAVVTYQLPFAKSSHGVLHGVAAGWTGNLMGTWQTGTYFTLGPGLGGGGGGASTPVGGTSCLTPYQLLSGGSNPTWCPQTWSGVGAEQRPSVVPGCNPNKGRAGFQRSTLEWYDPSCFQLQTYGTYGNLHSNQILGPGMKRADLSVNKTFDLHENYKLQLRMEGFNITNTPFYANPNKNISCGNYTTAPNGSTYAWQNYETTSNNCSYLDEAAGMTSAGALYISPTTTGASPSDTANGCASTRNYVSAVSGAGGGGPGGGPSYPGCIQTVQGDNRSFQFALRLTF
jgi:hypothetical protein